MTPPAFAQLDDVRRVLVDWSPTNQNVVDGNYAAAINDLRTAHRAERDAAETLTAQLVAVRAELDDLRGRLSQPVAAVLPAHVRIVTKTGVTVAPFSKAADPRVAWAELTCGHTVFRATRPELGAMLVCEICAKQRTP